MTDPHATGSRARTIRALVVVNIALIPYVWLRFPREARAYTRRCWEIVRGH